MNTHSPQLKSIEAFNRYGVTPSIIHYIIKHHQVITPSHSYYDCLQTCYLLYWNKEYLLQQFQEGVIRKDNVLYHPVFSVGLSRGALLRMPAGTQISMSFREAQQEFGLPAYVFISPAKRSGGHSTCGEYSRNIFLRQPANTDDSILEL